MKIKYALVKVLMLVGDVRNAMVAMGTSGTKDVLAHLPDDDALQAKDEVFRPIFSVARKEGNCALLDDLSENVMIGSDRKQNLKMALYAIVESKPTSIDVDKIKTLASQINARSFYNRVMKAQRTAAPDVLTYIFLAACCYFLPILIRKGVKPAIEYYAKLQETDVSIAYAVEVRRKKFNTSFGVMIKMVKGVKGIDPEKVKKGIEEVESKMDLLPSSGTSDTIHVMNLISKLERADLERYTDKELDTLRNYISTFAIDNDSLDDSVDGPTRMVISIIEADRLILQPFLVFVQWVGKMLVPIAITYYILTILKAIVDTAVDIYKMSLLKQFFNSTLLILTVIAVGNVCLGQKNSSVSITTAIALCIGSLAMWRGQLFVPKM
jgi:hypothetical protein